MQGFIACTNGWYKQILPICVDKLSVSWRYRHTGSPVLSQSPAWESLGHNSSLYHPQLDPCSLFPGAVFSTEQGREPQQAAYAMQNFIHVRWRTLLKFKKLICCLTVKNNIRPLLVHFTSEVLCMKLTIPILSNQNTEVKTCPFKRNQNLYFQSDFLRGHNFYSRDHPLRNSSLLCQAYGIFSSFANAYLSDQIQEFFKTVNQ